MSRKQILVATIAIISAICLYKVFNFTTEATVPIHIHNLFAQWGAKYNKIYSTPQEQLYRLRVFHQTYKRVTAKQKIVSYQVGLTQFADLTLAEAKARYTGLIFVESKRNPIIMPNKNFNNPTSVDWRKEGAVNSVKNQGQCGSCWAFSTIASLEAAYKLSGHSLLSFSEQQLVDCSTSQGNMGCNGGWMDWAFKYIEGHGIELESDYPYRAVNQHCSYNSARVVAGTRVKSFVDVPHYQSKYLETAAVKTVVSVTVDASKWYDYKGGILDSNCGTSLDHGVAVVGYGEESGKDYWIVRNSWSASWGENGYIRVAKSLAYGPGMCGIAMKASYPVL